MSTIRGARKVLLLEFNEITWTVADRFMRDGKMPHLTRLRAEGTAAAPEALERPPFLDPWISWVTLHTGVDRSVHGALVLEQDVTTIRAKRTWDYALEAGKSVGIFGSISAYPPRPVPGFMVPGPFAPGPETYPKYVEPVQRLNRKYTQVHHKNAEADTIFSMAKQGVDLLRLGLRPETCAQIALQLATERVKPHMHWKRVTLQPLVNYDFFAGLYDRYKPDFATWHSNHAAHFQHHYWRAWDDTGFPSPATDEERRKFGGAMEHGYRVVDDLIGRFAGLIDDDTVLVVASALGQRPYSNDLYPEGKVCVKFKDVRQVLDIVGAKGVTDVVPVMDPQWNVKIPDDDERARVRDARPREDGRRHHVHVPDGGGRVARVHLRRAVPRLRGHAEGGHARSDGHDADVRPRHRARPLHRSHDGPGRRADGALAARDPGARDHARPRAQRSVGRQANRRAAHRRTRERDSVGLIRSLPKTKLTRPRAA